MSNIKHFNTAEWPWDKSVHEIAQVVGLLPYQVIQVRKMINGTRQFHTLKWEARYGSLPWKEMDWKKTNSEIAGILGVEPGIVRLYRLDHGIPYTDQLRQIRRSATANNEKLDKVNWELFNDVEISQQLGVSRERVRQLRLRLSKGASRADHLSIASRNLFRWCVEHRAEIEGKLVHEVIALIPDAPVTHVIRKQLLKLQGRLGFEFDWTSQVAPHAGKYEHFNFHLSNKALSLIWGASNTSVANYRHQNRKPKPRWRIGGLSAPHRNKPYIEAVWAEITKVNQRGYAIDARTACEMLRIPTPDDPQALAAMNQNLKTETVG